MISLSDDSVRGLRIRAQHLTAQSAGAPVDVAQVVQAVCGIQAQEVSAAALSIRARSIGLMAADVEKALVQGRSVIRTWGQRGTFHLLATEDLPWLLPLFGPVFIAASQRRRVELGLNENICARGICIIRDVLANQEPLTRAELVEHLESHSLHIEGQARPHLLHRAALEGIICLGPDRDKEPTYVLLSDWVSLPEQARSLSQNEAVAKLALRYLRAYGPATPEDMAAWSGLPLGWIRSAWQEITDQLLQVEINNRPAWMLKTCATWLNQLPESAPVVRLLPRYDTYLLGYQKRDLIVPPHYARRVNAGGGIVHPTLLVDGQVVGTWKSKRLKSHLDVTVEPFEPLAPQALSGLEAEINDLARFLSEEVRLQSVLQP